MVAPGTFPGERAGRSPFGTSLPSHSVISRGPETPRVNFSMCSKTAHQKLLTQKTAQNFSNPNTPRGADTAQHSILRRCKIRCGVAPHRPYYLRRNQSDDRMISSLLAASDRKGRRQVSLLIIAGSEHDRRSKGMSQACGAVCRAGNIRSHITAKSDLSRAVKELGNVRN
jgi:hypothetical protein